VLIDGNRDKPLLIETEEHLNSYTFHDIVIPIMGSEIKLDDASIASMLY